MCILGKIFGSKIIYIETFANHHKKTATGRLIYPIADLFIVQWEEMLEIYPKAVYGLSLIHIYSDNEFNTRCDELARNAIE